MKKKRKNKIMDYVKANRKGSRESELEITCGFNSTHKVHKSKKSYIRKPKHKNDYID